MGERGGELAVVWLIFVRVPSLLAHDPHDLIIQVRGPLHLSEDAPKHICMDWDIYVWIGFPPHRSPHEASHVASLRVASRHARERLMEVDWSSTGSVASTAEAPARHRG